MYKKCTSNSYIYTKNVQTVQNLYNIQTKNNLKLEMYTNNVQTIQDLYQIIYTPANVCFMYTTSLATLFTFWIFASITMSSSVLFWNFAKFQDQSFDTQKDSQMNLY